MAKARSSNSKKSTEAKSASISASQKAKAALARAINLAKGKKSPEFKKRAGKKTGKNTAEAVAARKQADNDARDKKKQDEAQVRRSQASKSKNKGEISRRTPIKPTFDGKEDLRGGKIPAKLRGKRVGVEMPDYAKAKQRQLPDGVTRLGQSPHGF